MKYTFIKSKKELRSYLQAYEDRNYHIIALDLEAELNLHAYGERLCLIQIYDGTDAVLIDPFGLDTETLKVLFERKNILKVIYDASSDSSLMKNAYNIEIKPVLDLRPAVDILNYEKKDLQSVIASELGIILDNKAKYQKHNWTRRPLDEGAIDYALSDVVHLLKLKDAILKKLCSRKLLELFFLKNLEVNDKDYVRIPGDKYRKVKGYHDLSAGEKGVFRKLYDVREKFAKQYNMPPHNIASGTALINTARDARCINEVRFPKRFSREMILQIVQELGEVARG